MDMELLFDFSINLPRVILTSNYVILDNVNRILSFSDVGVVADNGLRFTAVNGQHLKIKDLKDNRLILTGNITSVEFFTNKKDD